MQYYVTVLAVSYMLPSIPTRKFRTWLYRASDKFICYTASEIYNSVALAPGRYKYKQYTVEHNSMILLRSISYIVSFNDMFRLYLRAIFRLITLLSKVKYAISNLLR